MKPEILTAVQMELVGCAKELFRGDLSLQLREIQSDENRWIEEFVSNVTDESSPHCKNLRSAVGWHEKDNDPFNSLNPNAWDILTLAKPREKWWAFAISRFQDLNGKRVLDVGGGTALLARVLNRAGIEASVTLVDLSNKWTDYARTLAIPGLEVVCQDIRSFSSDIRFDAAFSFMAFHHIKNTDSAMEAVRRNLASGATFSLTDKIGFAASNKDKQRIVPHPPAPEWIRSLEQTCGSAESANFTVLDQHDHASNIVNLYCEAC